MEQASDAIYNKHRITPPKNERQTLMGVKTQTESKDDGEQCVKFRAGIPKFLQPTNQRVADLKRTDVGFQTPPKNEKIAPSTPKSQRQPKRVGTPKLPTCLAEIPVTPENKYGFLRSFDGKIKMLYV